MKRIVLLLTIALQIIAVVGCYSKNQNLSYETSYSELAEVAVSIDAMHFSSEQQMITQILTGEKTDNEHQLELIEFYFRPIKLPEGAKLIDIRVKAFYISLDYVIGNEEPMLGENLFTFVWYRTMRGDDMKNGFIRAGLPWEPMSKNSSYNYYISENYARNSEGNIDKNLPLDQICTVIEWVQNDYCFHVNAPLTFTEDNALEYCIAEKVIVR